MNENKARQQASDEIDLGLLLQKIGDFFKWIIKGIYRVVMFYKRFAIVLLVLLLIAFAVGYFIDSSSGSSSYRSELVVVPNFGSADYLYSGVREIETKRRRRDTEFFKRIQLEDLGSFYGISVAPVIDIYGFLTDEDRLNVFNALKGDLALAKDEVTAVNYKYHRITIRTGKKNDAKKIVSAVLGFLNDNEYYSRLGDSLRKNTISRLETSREAVLHINDILKKQGEGMPDSIDKGDAAIVLRSETTGTLAELVRSQQQLFETIDSLSTGTVDTEKTIRSVAERLDLPQKSITTTKKWMFPLVVFIAFSGGALLVFLFKKMKAIATEG
ncbi:hypothetical protein [Sinomicrobium sp.]